jgi:DNA polymerase
LFYKYLREYELLYGNHFYLDKNLSESHYNHSNSKKDNINDDLDKRLSESCDTCRKFSARKKIVYGHGVSKPEIFIILESPSEIDVHKDQLLSGLPGKLFDKILIAINKKRKKDVYISSILKYKLDNNRDPLVSDISNCIEHLNKKINIMKPKLILLLGNVVAKLLLQKGNKVNDFRNKTYHYNKIPTFITYHPASLIRDEKLKLLVWQDFKNIKFFLENEKANDK